MARVLIIGASKGIGLETTRQALEAGHQVRALARSAASIALSDPKLEKVRGDALISKDIEGALNGIEVVIQTLGVSGVDSVSASKPFLSRNTRSGERYGKPGGETADLRHRFWGGRQLCEHKLLAAGAVPTACRSRL
jgi:NAD(P)-dependent dehydrogenase (short-subunit alcohol dehydrogenase family)